MAASYSEDLGVFSSPFGPQVASLLLVAGIHVSTPSINKRRQQRTEQESILEVRLCIRVQANQFFSSGPRFLLSFTSLSLSFAYCQAKTGKLTSFANSIPKHGNSKVVSYAVEFSVRPTPQPAVVTDRTGALELEQRAFVQVW